ncbi:MAG: tRNA A-37 threonylcarbamoyl transferase component Bud32 [Ilumatobacter sp.]|jgi:tRNA A-37 threonylcarbamoyl transferase component Bud32
MRLQIASPSGHPHIAGLPFTQRLNDWTMPNMHGVLGLHRHVVRLIELDGTSYVIKELPDDLVHREYHLLRELADAGLPTAEVVAAVTGKADKTDGMLVTRHLDYSIPYRTLLSGRGLTIPYLGERVLDALVGLLVRLHLAGFFWGDCSLSNTLFRRDAGALSAYVIDMETGERHDALSDGQRSLDLQVATENVAGGLLDLQAGNRLRADIDPMDIALQIEDRYHRLWTELTASHEFAPGETFRIEQRLQRLHDLGFDVEEMDIVDDGEAGRYRYIPRVVEHGFHRARLQNLTGLGTTENQAKRLLDDIRSFGADMLQERIATTIETGRPLRPLPENVIAVRWLDERFEPLMAKIPPALFDKLEAAEIYHQLLEHRWFLSEKARVDVGLDESLASYINDVLVDAPNEVNITRERPAEGSTFDGHE